MARLGDVHQMGAEISSAILFLLRNTSRNTMTNLVQNIKKNATSGVGDLAKRAIDKAQPISDRATAILSKGMGAIGASLSGFADIPFDYTQIAQIQNAVKNHSIKATDAIGALPDELTKYGTQVVERFLKEGDPQGKHWSHIESQANNPKQASDPGNAVWEDGSANISRGSRDMTIQERVGASFDNHKDAFLTAVQTQEFWERTLGNAFEASVYAAAISGIDMLLIHRDELLNASIDRKKEIVLEILKNSGLMAAGALPVSVFLGVALLLIPGLSVVMTPLGVAGTVGISIRLISSLVNNPSQQEMDLLKTVQSHLQGFIYDVQNTVNGSVVVNVKPVVTD